MAGHYDVSGTYPVSNKLSKALEQLYPGSVEGVLALGTVGVPKGARRQSPPDDVPEADRIRELIQTLEGWVELNGAEVLEFETEVDLNRIRSEARATLLVLRELHRLFPHEFDDRTLNE